MPVVKAKVSALLLENFAQLGRTTEENSDTAFPAKHQDFSWQIAPIEGAHVPVVGDISEDFVPVWPACDGPRLQTRDQVPL